jgi:hypothetical protein
MWIDPTGMDDFEFDTEGNYVGVTTTDTKHRGVIKNEKGEVTRTFAFADPINDTQDIRDGKINKVIFVSKVQINTLLKNSGATKFKNKLPIKNLFYLKNNSKINENSGYLDFSYKGIPQMFGEQGATDNPGNCINSPLFLPDGESVAHNQMNFGNFMWGASANELGVSLEIARIGAHWANYQETKGTNYDRWDSQDDQLSITLGWLFKEGGASFSPKIIMK